MKVLKPNSMFFIFIAICVSFITASQAMSAMTAEVRADNEGFYIKYNLKPFLGSKEVTLAPGDPPAEVFVIKGIITIEAEVMEITTQPNSVKINIIVSSPFLGQQPNTVSIPIPFGEYGASVSFKEHQFIPLENHDIEASFLLTKLKTQYAVQCNLVPLFTGLWEGSATPDNNTIHEMVLNPSDNSTIAEITLVLSYVSAYFTSVDFNIVLTPPTTGGNGLFPVGGDAKTPQPITGKIFVPNGTYHIWVDPDLTSITDPE